MLNLDNLTEEQLEAKKLLEQGMSNREVARVLWERESKESTLRNWMKQGLLDVEGEEVVTTPIKEPKVVFLDVETSGEVSLHFGRWKTNISPKAVISPDHMLTFAYCTLEDDEIIGHKLTDYDLFEEDPHSDYELIKEMWEVLDNCDILIAHNGSFDEGKFNARCAYWQLPPPSNYKLICTLKGLKKHFKLPANSLDSATRYFGLTRKLDNAGVELWVRCYLGEKEAFDEMLEYNIGDIPTLKQLYLRIRPFMKQHPNMGLYYEDFDVRCPKCGSKDLALTGKEVYTGVSKFPEVRCNSCGSPHIRTRTNVLDKELRKNLLTNAM